MNQFLKFLYTGQLEGAVNPKLLELAKPTESSHSSIIILCEEGLSGQDMLAEGLTSLTMMLKTKPDVLELIK